MKTNTASKILDYIQKKGKARPHDLLKVFGVSQVAIHKQLRGLIEKGQLRKEGKGPRVFYTRSHADIDNIINLSKPILHKYRIRKAALFGSVVRGDATSTSDIDMLINPPPQFSLFDRAGLTVDLEETLHRPIDVVEYQSIKPLMRDSILKYEYPFL